MKSLEAEKYLAVLYASAGILSAISLICNTTTWQYWTRTLNACLEIDCGCLFYATRTFNSFMGGDVKFCNFAAYGLIPVIFVSIVFGVYHGYRSCISRNLNKPQVIPRSASFYNRDDIHEDVVIVISKDRSPYKQWVLSTFLAAFIACLSLSHIIVVTDGYYKTCEEYQKNLINMLGSRGREAEAIHKRLACAAIFDFMDYLQPDENNWRRGDEINTGLALQFAIVSGWFNCFIWIIIFVITIIMTRQRKKESARKVSS